MATDYLVKVLEQGKMITRGIQDVDNDLYLEMDDDEIKLVTFDWSKWLGSETVSTKATETDGPTVVESSPSTTTTTVLISGDGGLIQHRVTTSGGRKEEKKIYVNSDRVARFSDYSRWDW